jgi:4-amino-4-deoxy-L-arabinose transferase-like glycosyltransferase
VAVHALRDRPGSEQQGDALVVALPRPRVHERGWRRLRSVAPATWAAAGIAGIAVFTTVWRLTVASWHVDEVLFAATGRSMLAGDFSRLWQHPPLAMFLYGVGQELPGGELLGVRLVAAAFGMATGALVYILGRRIAGQGAALIAAGLWAVLPHVTHPLGADVLVPRLDRYGLLDVVAAGFMAGALVTGWQWVTKATPGSRRATGVLVGLATAAKLTGVLVLPGIAALVLWYRGRRGLGEIVRTALLAAAVFALCYTPFGTTAPDAIGRMVRFQSEHLERGHSVVINGVVRQYAPWWAQFDFMWQGDGPLVVIPLVLAALAAVVLVRRPAVVYVAAAVVVPLVVMASSRVSLPHYRYVWLAPFLLLAALGFDRALSSGGWLRIAAIVLAVPLVAAGVATTWRVATLQPSDYRRAADMIREAGFEDGRYLAHGSLPIFRGELPDTDRVRLPEVADQPPDVVIVDRMYERRHPRPEVRDVARRLGLERVRVDRLDVFLPPGAIPASGR